MRLAAFVLALAGVAWAQYVPVRPGGAVDLAATGEADLVATVDGGCTFQAIDCIGGSTGWRAGFIGGRWPEEKLNALAELIFSTELDGQGNPKGVGFSGWRIEIGAGTAFQGSEGVASGIEMPERRSPCYLWQGRYHWENCRGHTWWLRKAHEYKVASITGYANSPPVFWTKNGKGYKTERSMDSNLGEGHYEDFARFLATVAGHFEREGTPFHYISPCNEPQWDWAMDPAKARQEGTPWRNDQIARLVRALNAELGKRQVVGTRVLITEAATLGYLAAPAGADDFALASSDQVRALWDPASENYVGNLPYVAGHVAGHGYFTDDPKQLAAARERLRRRIEEVNPNLDYWQSEYCILGEYNDKIADAEEGFLRLARVIHADFAVGNAAAWFWWATFSGRKPGEMPRYTLVGTYDLAPDFSDGKWWATKNLWVMGNWSRFVRPGMLRVGVERSDKAGPAATVEDLMLSAYRSPRDGAVVVVAVNYGLAARTVKLENRGLAGAPRRWVPYVTSIEHDLAAGKELTAEPIVVIPRRAVVTLVGLPQ